MRDLITFACSQCKRRNYVSTKNRNYSSTKNKKTTTERLEMKKFCPFCRKHQSHRETK